jgi:hypothetical protein
MGLDSKRNVILQCTVDAPRGRPLAMLARLGETLCRPVWPQGRAKSNSTLASTYTGRSPLSSPTTDFSTISALVRRVRTTCVSRLSVPRFAVPACSASASVDDLDGPVAVPAPADECDWRVQLLMWRRLGGGGVRTAEDDVVRRADVLYHGAR